jgi:hypothetical protein
MEEVEITQMYITSMLGRKFKFHRAIIKSNELDLICLNLDLDLSLNCLNNNIDITSPSPTIKMEELKLNLKMHNELSNKVDLGLSNLQPFRFYLLIQSRSTVHGTNCVEK